MCVYQYQEEGMRRDGFPSYPSSSREQTRLPKVLLDGLVAQAYAEVKSTLTQPRRLTMAMSRHQRRKAAKERNTLKSEGIAKASLAYDKAEIVRRNMGSPMERNYYPQSSMSDMAGQSHRGYICRASGGMGRQRALALKAQGKW